MLPEPPAPVQASVKVLLPVVEIVTASLPEVVLVPDQEPEAEQEVALEEDQVRVEVSVKRTVNRICCNRQLLVLE